MLVAALLHAGDDAVITGLAGLRLHRLHRLRRIEEPPSIHLLVPWTRQVRSHRFALIERTKRMPPRVERDGLPVAHLVRCLTDTVRRMKDHDRISALITDPVQRELLVVEQIHDELEAGCRRGTAAPRAVLGAVRLGVRSPAEFGAFEFWNSHDFPEALWNIPLLAPGDRSLIAIPDALVKDVGFAWEQDSVQEHFASRAQVLATRRRRQRLFDHNVYVLSSRPNDLVDDPKGVRREIEKGLEIAAGMPEPDVLYGEPGRRSG